MTNLVIAGYNKTLKLKTMSFNRLAKDVPIEIKNKKSTISKPLTEFKPDKIKTEIGDVIRIQLWNYVHRIGLT
jgi:hypothetical protein